MRQQLSICSVFGVFCPFPSISKHLGIQLCSSQVTHQKASMYTYHKEALHNNGFCLWTCRFMNDYSNACLTSKLSRWHWYCGCDAKVYLYCIEAKALQKPTWHKYDWKGVLRITRKCNILRWEPKNRHWKSGQQAPSVGTILTKVFRVYN